MRESLTIHYFKCPILVADDITFMEGLNIPNVTLNFILFMNEQEQIVLDRLHKFPQTNEVLITITFFCNFIFIHEEDDIECSIGDDLSFHEGYVIHNKFGSYKVVDREVFSHSNFTIAKSW